MKTKLGSDLIKLTPFRFQNNFILEQLYCYNGVKVHGTEVLRMFEKRFSYPCSYSDMFPRFE